MKGGIATIFKKEIKRFFSDGKMIFMTVIIPGLLIFLIYSVMGGALENKLDVESIKTSTVKIINCSDNVEKILAEVTTLEDANSQSKNDILEEIKEKEIDALVVMPEKFEEKIMAGIETPNIEIYYNSSSDSSMQTYEILESCFNSLEKTISNVFDINNGTEQYDLADSKEISGNIIAGLLPTIMVLFLYVGCLSVATESIAGEKERGTIATILVTKVKRRDIALGKILALGTISLLAAMSCLLGLACSLPRMMKPLNISLEMSIYGPKEYIIIAVAILTTAFVLVGIIAILSAISKSVKEAQTYSLPLMMIVMVVGFSTMFAPETQTVLVHGMIPFYSCIKCLVGVMSFNIDMGMIITMVISNIIYVIIEAIILTKVFNNEKIIFAN